LCGSVTCGAQWTVRGDIHGTVGCHVHITFSEKGSNKFMNIVSVTQDIFLRFVREVDFWLEVKEFVTSFEVVGEEEEAA